MLLISPVVVPALLVSVHGLVGRSGAVINAELGIGLLAGDLDAGPSLLLGVHLPSGLVGGPGGCIQQQLLDR